MLTFTWKLEVYWIKKLSSKLQNKRKYKIYFFKFQWFNKNNI